MEGSIGSSDFVRPRNKSTTSTRRYWSTQEELTLINAVKELIADGWKTGNGWRGGFYKQVEKKILERLPASNIKGEPHVTSKLGSWKKDYSLLFTLFGKSGQGLDYVDHTINIVGTETWETNVRANPNLEKLRGKPFPYYNEWKEIFGTDRASGEAALDPGATILAQPPTQLPTPDVHMNTTTNQTQRSKPGEEDDDAGSASKQFTDGSTSAQKLAGQKRKACAIADDPLVDMVGTLLVETKGLLTDLGHAIRSMNNVDPMVKTVYSALEKFLEFTIDDRVKAARKIVGSPTEVALFFSMDDAGKKSLVFNIVRESIWAAQ